ncbi:entericidin A/B family lipoprotein [Luteolibacter soli]
MLLGSVTAGLSSCATTRGVGRDVQTAGQKIEKAASH